MTRCELEASGVKVSRLSPQTRFLLKHARGIWWPDGWKGALVYVFNDVTSVRVTERMGSLLCALGIFDDGPGDGLRNASGIRNRHTPSPQEIQDALTMYRRAR